MTDPNELRRMYGYLMLMIEVCFAATVASVWLLWLVITQKKWRYLRLIVVVVLFPATWWGLNMLSGGPVIVGEHHRWTQIFKWISGYGFGLLVAAAWIFFRKPHETS